MNHKEIKGIIGAYADGELHGDVKKIVEEHIRTCADCASELEYILQLHETIRKEKPTVPADAYWDTFPKRVMERAKEQQQRSFFTVWLPRMKWELAGGIVLLLLTFVVSKQIFLRRVEEISIDASRFIGTEKAAPEDGFFAKDADETLAPAVSGGKAVDDVSKKGKALKGTRVVSGEEGEVEPGVPDVESRVLETPKTVSTIAKGADVDDKEALKEDEMAGAAEVAKSGGLSEPAPVEANKEAIIIEGKKAPATKAEEVGDIMADLETERDEIAAARFAQVAERSQNARRGLLRLLYNEAGRTRKRADIERAMREIEFYQDSYPEDFHDTLVIFSDSLQLLIEEVERQEAEQEAPSEETETK